MSLLFVVLALAAAAPPTLSDLEDEVVCPTCKTTLDQSDAPIAERMRAYIRERIAAGDTKQEIKDKLVAQFGTRVLAEPPKRGFDLLAWVLPLVGAAVGAAAIGLVAWRWRRAAPAGGPIDPELERRLDQELARFDG
ncbi:MAG: cytochrome c-type biogenesis protein [Gaiellaceae bacterium]